MNFYSGELISNVRNCLGATPRSETFRTVETYMRAAWVSSPSLVRRVQFSRLASVYVVPNPLFVTALKLR